ncbi:F-type H+-transporting ATPase subunit epsilon [Paraburkholderia sp. Clong3]|uniref:ATP synthase epsilon chain n=1 Tax=Paraburkholderia tuberum TaxID=157910 RepID=A0A1H1HI96_9BURK|nr:F0F1 ATP synthase subunit epsilon [Paraburkholderia tuberum]SDR24836.1 F-type H+-transporting ATPase subunit epsilon [Paraburkholderia tuberum]
MPRHGLSLTIATPARVMVDGLPVVSLRAEDESGAFGVRVGHADMVTLLSASVVRWRTADGGEHYCAVDGGVLIVSHGTAVSLACREAVQGDSLEALEADVRRARAAQLDAMRRARVEQTRLHAQAVRQMLRYLRPQATRGEPG